MVSRREWNTATSRISAATSSPCRAANERRCRLQTGQPAYRRNCRCTRRSGSGTDTDSPLIVVSSRGLRTSRTVNPVMASLRSGMLSDVTHKIRETYHMDIKVPESDLGGPAAGDPEDGPAVRGRRRLGNEIKESLRELSVQLSLLNHQVVARLDLNDADLQCLE